jgi:3-oxoadipate enol-lactonase
MSFISCNGHVIHYSFLSNNSDQTFLFINSLGTDFRIWEEVAGDLKDFGNILLYDKRGHGLSDLAKGNDGLKDYAEDAGCLLETLSIQNCIVIGISVGGMIAPMLAYYYPRLIKKLIVCGAANKIGTTETWNERISQVRSNGLRAITDGLMKRWFSSSFHGKYPERIAGYKNMVERCDVEGYIQTSEAIRDEDITGISKSLRVPTLCIVGSEDQSVSPADVKALSQSIKDSKLEIINGSHHMTCIDNREIFTKLTVDFIKSNQ